MTATAEISWCEALAGTAGVAPDQALDDTSIIEEFLRSGNDEAFGVLVRRYQDRVFRLIVSVLGPTAETEAEDLVQEVFITVYRKLATFRGDCKFSTWLYRLARNRAIDSWRRRKPVTALSRDRLREAEEPNLHVDLDVEQSRRDAVILNAVSDLGEPRRSVIFLFYWMGCSVGEISVLTEIPVGTVKSHLSRARRELAGNLGAEAIDG